MTKMQISLGKSTEDKTDCYHLRHIVFVEEQGVPVEMEIDDHDENGARHYMGRYNGTLVATARVCVFDAVAKIQRVAVLKEHRGKGFGQQLMQFMMDDIRSKQLAPQISLDAQTYAQAFYQALGFVAEGEVFDDAGIDHIHMRQLS